MALCTISEVEDVLSYWGAKLATDDERADASPDTTKVDNAIERATVRIHQYISLRYETSVLESNDWAKWCCAVFASVQLMRRRGGAVPPGLMDEYNEFIAHLEKVQSQLAEIPGVTQQNEPGLTMSNLTVDQRFRSAKIRAIRSVSAGETSSKKPRRMDYHEGFDW